MKIRTKAQHGFSLVEVLLTLVLILCLAGASVFTFTAIYRSANLDEGYDRFQSLIRFAQAEAATTGRKVRIEFAQASSNNATADDRPELRNIRITWESDLLNKPGVFETYTNKAWSEDIVNELVGVEKVQPLRSPALPKPDSELSGAEVASNVALTDQTDQNDAISTSGSTTGATSESSGADVSSSSSTGSGGDFPSITFYPDGSCDSAEIVLASRNPEDERRVAVRLSGILGSVSSRTVSAADNETDSMDDPFDEFGDNSDTLSADATTSGQRDVAN